MQKIIIAIIGIIFLMGLTGCMGNNAQDMGSPNMIKIIREPKYNSNSEPRLRKIQTGKIEPVDYNSSIISPEREGYKAPEPPKQSSKNKSSSKNQYRNKVISKVGNKVSSKVVSRVENKADTVVDGVIDNALGRLFR